MKYSVKWCFIC